jgi:prevent-host-death family protein
MAAQWTLQDAKNRFSVVVEAALAGEPQRVTRRGRWVGVVISAALDQASAPSLPELLLALPQDDEPFERIALTPREFPCT